jgi:uroporphyrinogen-III synthase
MAAPDFQNRLVLTLESRRAVEIAKLVATYGGRVLSAPALRDVPLESNTEALAFARELIEGHFHVVVLLTGVGLRTLLAVVESAGEREPFVEALGRTRVVARGPKPVAALREIGLTPWLTAPEPNTWRELLAVLDERGDNAVRGAQVAVQEYGTSNQQLLDGLKARGAQVTSIHVYRYALPDDTAPLERAVGALLRDEVDIALFTTGTQVAHLLQVAASQGRADDLRRAFGRVVVASIGPTTSEELREQQIDIDFEASHPKMGFLVREAAERGPELVAGKKARPR